MRPHLQVRRIVKRYGTLLAVIVAIAWACSLFAPITYYQSHGVVMDLSSGRFRVIRVTDSRFSAQVGDLIVGRRDFDMEWGFSFHSDDRGSLVGIPLWFPFLALAVPTPFAWRVDFVARRRAAIGKCKACGYDLAGIANPSACPECGKTV